MSPQYRVFWAVTASSQQHLGPQGPRTVVSKDFFHWKKKKEPFLQRFSEHLQNQGFKQDLSVPSCRTRRNYSPMSHPSCSLCCGLTPLKFKHLNAQSKPELLLCYCCMAWAEKAPVRITAPEHPHTSTPCHCHSFLQFLCSADTEFLSFSRCTWDMAPQGLQEWLNTKTEPFLQKITPNQHHYQLIPIIRAFWEWKLPRWGGKLTL